MNNQEILEIEVSLLFIKYGYNKIVEAISKIKNEPINEVELKLNSIKKITIDNKISKENYVDAVSTVTKLISPNSDIAPKLIELAKKWDNKLFLPQMNDVRKFMERNGAEKYDKKSRKLSVKDVFVLLSKMDKKSLDELLNETSVISNDLSIISNQIFKKN